MRDLFALSRSGHTVIYNWLGGHRGFRNQENCKVSGRGGVVVLREYSSWLASFMAGEMRKEPCRHGVNEPLIEADGRPEAVVASEVWLDHATAYLRGEADPGEVYPVSWWHWMTSRVYADKVAADVLRRPAPGTVPGSFYVSTWEKERPILGSLPVQRWRLMREHPLWGEFRDVYSEERECRGLSREIFRISFDEEILS